MIKLQTAALGFRVKSGWATAVLLTGPARSPQLCDIRRVDLSDPRFPETRQPYHAAKGKLQTDAAEIKLRTRVVRRIAQRSITALLAKNRQNGYRIRRAGVVVGSQINPASIANPHIRAHAFEGQLFRSVLEESLQAHGVHTEVVIERDAYAKAAVELKRSDENVRRVIQNLGRDTEAPWRAEQKLAALAAWLALH
jgi:hypothetical protein